ncbi:SoxR reducing system RseC family protein [Glaciecola petra]|uniref:SoxR reducing system RseC family protein n=1 Tax=Glaciecola petra TaxID=3075602 RepID=A0ABU2ZT73_9ALTE|nr:SoxR reducing system RseC family protein [Aestuariibacter sp. P117]MDT0595810.1 SoxR reducing system RseC family protein [Aestuariibacter sp. P117]
MIEEMGTVVAIEDDGVWVETQIKTTCSSCQASESCPTSTVAKAFSPKANHVKLSVPCQLVVGQKVKMGISEHALLRASWMVYMVPLLLLMSTVTMLSWIWPNLHELLVLLFASISAIAGFWWASSSAKNSRNVAKYKPIFLGATQDLVMTHKNEIPTFKH